METNKDLILRNIKDFTDLMFFRFSIEKNLPKKIEQSKKILELYHIYQNKSAVYSLEIQSKINILKTF